MATKIKICHTPSSPPVTRLALLPTGMYTNTELRTAANGAEIIFYEGWREDAVRLVRKSMIKTNSGAFALLSRQLYNLSPQSLLELWKAERLLQGERIDLTECLLIEYEEQIPQH